MGSSTSPFQKKERGAPEHGGTERELFYTGSEHGRQGGAIRARIRSLDASPLDPIPHSRLLPRGLPARASAAAGAPQARRRGQGVERRPVDGGHPAGGPA